MMILDYDRHEKACPVCKQARLVFITDAPELRSVGKTLQYRCKACAIEEAKKGTVALEVVCHTEKRALANAWRNDAGSPWFPNSFRPRRSRSENRALEASGVEPVSPVLAEAAQA